MLKFLKVPESPNCNLKGVMLKKIFLFALFVNFICESSFAKENFTLSNKIFDNSKLSFISHAGDGKFDSYLTMEVQFKPAAELFTQLLIDQRKQLSNRGEAHITVITPIEYFNILKPQGILISEIDEIAKKYLIQRSNFEVICIGRGTAIVDGKSEETYYIVVNSKELRSLRFKIQELFISKGGRPADFKADNYFPHITLGFTKRDLHESDGVIKNSNSCWSDIKLF